MNIKLAMATFVASIFLFLVGACDNSPPSNQAPTVNAGTDQIVSIGTSVDLSATATDADKDKLSYTWTLDRKPVESKVSLSSVNTASTSFSPDKVGDYVLTIQVDDGKSKASDSLKVTATASSVNNPPVLSDIEDQSSAQSETVSIAFTVSDESPDSLTLKATSSDQDLVADSDIDILGSGTNRNLEITPQAGIGSITISLTVTDDQSQTDSTSFKLILREAFSSQFPTLMASDGTAEDWFGTSVSISGDYAIVGASYNDDKGESSGSAYIYKRNGGSWTEVEKLTASDGAAEDYFGDSVSISGDYAIVGADGNDDKGQSSGSAYIFKRSGDDWAEVKKLTAADGAKDDIFGSSVSISGDYAIVGAPLDDDKGNVSGSAYIFKRSGDDWTETGKLTAGDGAKNERFGTSIFLSGDYAIVGTPFDNDKGQSSGSAYIFKRSGDDWTEVEKLMASDGAAEDRFGTSVSISGDHAIIGAYFDDDKGESSGSAYIYKRNGGSWTEVEKLTASDGASRDIFGASVSISTNYAIVGAEEDDDEGDNSGSVYIYKRNGDSWTEVDKVTARDGTAGDRFGNAVSLSDNYAIVGAYWDSYLGNMAGSTYIFQK